MQIEGKVCMEGRVWKGEEEEVLDSQRHKKKLLVFFCHEEVIFQCSNTLSLLFTFPSTSKYLAERDASLS